MSGRVHQINISPGGVPKLPIESAALTREGLEGDGHNDYKHGGPDRAVCLFSLELIEALKAEGHPIYPGSCGENLTIQGLDWPAAAPGSRLAFSGGVELEVVSFCNPCSAIRDSFTNLGFNRIKHELRPGWSRLYARVLREGRLTTGESVVLTPPAP